MIGLSTGTQTSGGGGGDCLVQRFAPRSLRVLAFYAWDSPLLASPFCQVAWRTRSARSHRWYSGVLVRPRGQCKHNPDEANRERYKHATINLVSCGGEVVSEETMVVSVHLRPIRPEGLDFVLDSEQDPANAPFILPWTRDRHARALCGRP